MPLTGVDATSADMKQELITDVSGQTAPAAFSLLSLQSASHLWPNSAPEALTIEPFNPTGSNATSYGEVMTSELLQLSAGLHIDKVVLYRARLLLRRVTILEYTDLY